MIDTSVARAAGGPGTTVSPSRECTQFLRDVLEICHHVVMSPEMLAEWKGYLSWGSGDWLASMFARKKVRRIELADGSLKIRIAQVVSDDARLRAIYKDLHLVQAGLVTDRLVASRDNNAKRDFSRLCSSIQELRDLIWVNPATDAGLSDWLESGAEFDDSLALANVGHASS